MKRVKIVGLALVALVAMAVAATSAMAILPTVLIALGEAFPVIAEGSQKGASDLETTSGSFLKGTLVSVLIDFAKEGALGTYDAHFTGVEENAVLCHTPGASFAEGAVLIEGEIHLVFTSLSPLEVGALFLVPAGTLIECGSPAKTKIKVEGSALSSLTATLNTQITKFSGALLGSKGKPALSHYENSTGESAISTLLSNFGLGFEPSNEQVEKPIEFTSSEMFEIMG